MILKTIWFVLAILGIGNNGSNGENDCDASEEPVALFISQVASKRIPKITKKNEFFLMLNGNNGNLQAKNVNFQILLRDLLNEWTYIIIYK